MLSRCLNCKFTALIGKASHIFKHVNWLPIGLSFSTYGHPYRSLANCTHAAHTFPSTAFSVLCATTPILTHTKLWPLLHCL